MESFPQFGQKIMEGRFHNRGLFHNSIYHSRYVLCLFGVDHVCQFLTEREATTAVRASVAVF